MMYNNKVKSYMRSANELVPNSDFSFGGCLQLILYPPSSQKEYRYDILTLYRISCVLSGTI